MKSEQKQHIEKAITEGGTITSSECLQQGLKIYRHRFRDFAWFSILVPFLGSIFTFLGLGSLGMLVLMIVISPVLNAGYYKAIHSIVEQEEWSFSHFFSAREKAVPLIINSFLGIFITALVLMPMYYLFERVGFLEWYYEVVAKPEKPPAPPEMSSSESTSFFLNLIPLIYLQVGFSWSFLLILFYDTNPLSALEYSRRLVTRRWGAQFMLLFTFFSFFMLLSLVLQPLVALNAGIANVASFALFLLFPWAYSSLYVGFREATEIAEKD